VTTILAPSPAKSARLSRDRVAAAAFVACRRIAPLWPLRHFVAVNPFLGFSNRSFEATCAMMRRVTRVDMLMPRSFYREAIADGIVSDEDLERARLAAPGEWPVPRSLAAMKAAIAQDRRGAPDPGARVATVAEVLDRLAAGDRHVARTAFMVDEISKFCAAYFDDGQSVWKLPSRDLGLYAAWRGAMRFDRNPETMGISRFRDSVAGMPDEAIDAIAAVVEAQEIPDHALEDYLHRALFEIGGWAAHARWVGWGAELDGRRDETLTQLLAVRVVWGYALFRERTDPEFVAAWRAAMAAAATIPRGGDAGGDPDLALDLVLHEAYEGALRRRLIAKLAAPRASTTPARAPAQAAFCIDVRSEVFRRALETALPGVQTIGFAGFFGYPIEYVRIGEVKGGAQCPVLLKPSVIVCEAVERASPAEEDEIFRWRQLRRRAAKAWKSFKLSAISCFTFVEAAGALYAVKLVGDALGLSRPVADPDTDGIDARVLGRIGPRIEPRVVGGRPTGFDSERRVAMAENALRGMSLTRDFARLVLIVGHGASTVNNPHASSLDCGACGGHTGEANARVAAAILNDPETRIGLTRRGIAIPDDVWFLGCLHDTTTDEVEIFNASEAPATHRAELADLRERLALAGELARAERAPRLRAAPAALPARARDWSEARPEWGLAGNCAFIAAPRSATRGLDLGGRAFLHDYDWRSDGEFRVLDLIMTAPMVVASWINLQYYASTVNNRAFGAGNKALHNVAGAIGVIEGNAGDLKAGLPWQSVHDGRKFVHEPTRLNVFIAAPTEAIDGVISRREAVRELLDNRWLHLIALSDDGRPAARYRGELKWEALA
jgi:hypothetical protein